MDVPNQRIMLKMTKCRTVSCDVGCLDNCVSTQATKISSTDLIHYVFFVVKYELFVAACK